MKANEAPEKLYLHPTAKGNVGASWLIFPLTNEDIEYSRTDAFIEKAAEWLNDKIEDYISSDGEWNVDFNIIDDFEKYMKGE